MRIYAVADIHGRQSTMQTIERTGAEIRPDVMVVAGDLTGQGRDEEILAELDALPFPVFVVHGNIDPSGMERAMPAMKNMKWIHGNEIRHDGVPFVGLGGGLTFPSLEFLGKRGRQAIDAMGELLRRETVLVTHCPPWNVLDRGFLGLRSGSKELERIVEMKKPRLLICGHIHECRGVESLRETVVVNCSLGHTGAGAVIDLDSGGTVRARLLG